MAYNTGIQLGASLLNLLDVEKIWTSIDADGKILLMHITECVKMKRRYALPAAVLRKKIQLTHNFGKSIPALRIFPLEVVCMFFGLWLNRIVWVFWFVLTPDVKFPKVRWWHGLLVAHRNRIPHFSPHYINQIFEMHPGPHASEVGCFRGILLEAFWFQKSWGPGYKKS